MLRVSYCALAWVVWMCRPMVTARQLGCARQSSVSSPSRQPASASLSRPGSKWMGKKAFRHKRTWLCRASRFGGKRKGAGERLGRQGKAREGSRGGFREGSRRNRGRAREETKANRRGLVTRRHPHRTQTGSTGLQHGGKAIRQNAESQGGGAGRRPDRRKPQICKGLHGFCGLKTPVFGSFCSNSLSGERILGVGKHGSG